MTSPFIEHLRREEASPSPIIERTNTALRAVAEMPASQLPPLEMMNIIGSHTREHFVNTMKAIFSELVNRTKLLPTGNVLDIGCGCGRLALPFSHYLTHGKYFGVDVWQDGISWCQANIAAKHPNFSFRALSAANNYYFEQYDPLTSNQYVLDNIPDGSIDLAFALSVLTHLTEADCRQYLRELSRTLRSDRAIAYITAFIIDVHFFRYRDRTQQHAGVQPVTEGAYQAYAGQDFFAGYTMPKWRQMVEESGLQIVSYESGSWAEKPGARVYQDTFIVVR